MPGVERSSGTGTLANLGDYRRIGWMMVCSRPGAVFISVRLTHYHFTGWNAGNLSSAFNCAWHALLIVDLMVKNFTDLSYLDDSWRATPVFL